MTISICVGSSCHLKGSYEIVNIIQELIQTHRLGKCANDGVSLLINNEFIEGCKPSNIKEIFKEKILDKIGG